MAEIILQASLVSAPNNDLEGVVVLASATTHVTYPCPVEWRKGFIEVHADTKPAWIVFGSSGDAEADATAASVEVAADTDAYLTSTATATTATEHSSFEAAAASIDPPMPISVTLDNHADHDAGSLVLTGTDRRGNALSETLTVPDGGNATLYTNAAFASLTAATHPAGSGTGGTYEYGIPAYMPAATAGCIHIPADTRIAIRLDDLDGWFSYESNATGGFLRIYPSSRDHSE